MRISAIKYYGHSDSEATIYRFVPKAGQRSNLYCHLGHPENLKSVVKAIQCCLSRGATEGGSAFRYVQLQLIDESGNSWTIEQKGEGRRYYQNDKPIEGDISHTQLGALLDWDTGDAIGQRGSDPFKLFELAVKGGEISAIATAAPLSGAGGVARIALEKSRELAHLMRGRYPAMPEMPSYDILPVVDPLIQLHFRWREIQNLAKTTRSELGFSKVDQGAVEGLEKEVALIERIRKIADPLLDPANTLSNIKDKLIQTEEKINGLAEKLGIDHGERDFAQINWDELIKHFARFKTKEIIIREMGASTNKIKAEIDPLVEEITATISGLLDNDTQVIGELKDCLKRVRKMGAPLAKEPQRRGWFGRSSGSKNMERNESRIQDGPSVIIGTDELAIEYGLARLSELRLSLKRIHPVVDKSMANLNAYYEKLTQEHGKTRADFDKYVKDHALPPLGDMKQIFGFLALHAELFHLKTMRDQLSGQLENNKVALRELEDLIQKWRALTGSQKANSLDRYSLILAEARGIISYLEQKTGRLDKLRRAIIQNGVIQNLLKQFKHSLAEVGLAWENHQRNAGLAPLAIDDPSLPDFFEKYQEIRLFVSQITKQATAFYGAQIFSSATLDAPMSIFVLAHDNLNNTQRIRLLEYLEQAPPSGLGILLTADAALTEMMQRIGISSSVAIKQKAKTPEPPTQGEVLSKRAEEVLRLLTNNKPVAKSASPLKEKR